LSSHCRSRRHNRRLLEDIYGLLYYHYSSCDMVVRPTILFEGFPVQNPVEVNFEHSLFSIRDTSLN
jgi:hypothetical protein